MDIDAFLKKMDPTQHISELDWLKNNPDFAERPASIMEFLQARYLNIYEGIRPGLKKSLVDIFGEEVNPYSLAKYEEAMMTGAIGIGKTTFASIVLPYMAHWVLCLKDPQKFFNLLPGSRIAFMMMSTSETQAREVIFADVFARIRHSEWFKDFPIDDKYKNQIRFLQKDIWIIPGDSAETTFEGYNILGGILDEMDSHRITPKKDYAEEGYNTISNRITSRFQDRGLLILIGQMKQSTGFAARKKRAFEENETAYVCSMTLWESFGWDKYLKPDGERKSFWFDVKRKIEIPALVAKNLASSDFIEIPELYRKQFINDPDKALKDLAGIPPAVGNPFIGTLHKIDLARSKWHQRFGVDESPVMAQLSTAEFAPWFSGHGDPLRRALHIDIAYSDKGDALGMAMGHIRELKEIDGELRPVFVFDMLLRMRPRPGQEIILADIRQIVYHLKDNLGFRIRMVTLDGFQSTDTIQQFNRRRIASDYLSVDRNVMPYEDLRDAIYEERIEFPNYFSLWRHGDTKPIDIAYQELTQLVDNGKKIEHPVDGSKDVTDAMAGVVHVLAGDRTYRRGVTSKNRSDRDESKLASDKFDPSQLTVPSRLTQLGASSGMPASAPRVPTHLLPGNGDIWSGTGITRPTSRP